jgi:hypothetical protein
MYALALQPLLNTLRERLTAITIGRHSQHSPALDYAHDLIIIITRKAYLDMVKEAIQTFERVSGAAMNPAKSTALPIGTWTKEPTILGIALSDHAKILGLEFASKMARSIDLSWARVTKAIRSQASSAYDQNLDFAHRIQFVMQYLLAKLWYTAQIFPATLNQTHRLTTICLWFLWKGAIIRVPATTLERPKRQGGWEFPNIDEKCRTIHYNRLAKQAHQAGTMTSALTRLLQVAGAMSNPLNIHSIPTTYPDRKSTRLNSSHSTRSRMPSSA